MKRPGRRHLAVVASEQDPRLQDSSPDLAEALERAAEKFGERMTTLPQWKYTNCLCGMLVRCRLMPATAETTATKIVMYGCSCPDCKRQVIINIVPPPTVVQVAQPNDVPSQH